ncbi:transglutaminase-like cysteine peptidase [Sphingomonas sp. OTU376]|uniref:transglutaminase-like cysteine peptidase n=1 Tax=Sphingomonas sp. OTU376 TaxID=3043863 RepID=UPI00313C1B17
MSAAMAAAGDSAGEGVIALRLADAPRWTDVLARAARDPAARNPLHCMMPADELPAECGPSGWRAAFAGLQGKPVADRVAGVQSVVNKLPYVPDLANWGMADRWETPAEMFARGGDCEDFALTKYFALRELGLAESAMRLAIVWDNRDAEQHAVLFVEADGQNWVLDNKFAGPVAAAELAGRYRVIWSVNRDGATLAVSDDAGQGPRLRTARGGRMLVLRTRPIRRDRIEPAGAPRVEVAAVGPVPAGIARLGAAVPAGDSPGQAIESASKISEKSVRDELVRAGEMAVRYTGK